VKIDEYGVFTVGVGEKNVKLLVFIRADILNIANYSHFDLLLVLLALGKLVKSLVSHVKHKVSANHEEVENVEDENIPLVSEVSHVRFIYKLRDYTCDITEENEAKEEKALALCGSCLVGLDNVEGPGRAEADDHDDLK
jgi:hypothetical protein